CTCSARITTPSRRGAMLRALTASIVLVASIVAAPSPRAQQAPAQPPVMRPLEPDVRDDGTVTFHLQAALASRVSVYLDTMTPASAVSLAKDARGIWNGQLGPLDPDIYNYVFLVDGVSVNAGLVEVVGRTPEAWHPQKVPHGAVHVHWYDAKALGILRSVYVYTPPGYERSNASYPVLYLLHGSGGAEDVWITIGAPNVILANL